LAQRRQDAKEVEEIERKIAEFDAVHGTGAEGTTTPNHDTSDVLTKLSEKNRKANAEAVRRAEIAEAERRRRERKLALAGNSGTVTPTDPSARLRTIPRTFNAVTPNSRLVYPHLIVLNVFAKVNLYSSGLQRPIRRVPVRKGSNRRRPRLHRQMERLSRLL